MTFQKRTLGVNLESLVDDIARQYSHLAHGLLRESIQNAIDAQASKIWIEYDEEENRFRARDNGRGMDREEFQDFFIIAESRKDPSRHIGQYGWGKIPYIKAGEYAVIETKHGDHLAAMRWQDLEYWPVETRELDHDGTLVEIRHVYDHVAEDLNPAEMRREIRRTWSSALQKGMITIFVNGAKVRPRRRESLYKRDIDLDLAGKRHLQGGLFYAKEDLSEGEAGVAVNVLGQTVKRTYFGISHPRRHRVFGHVDADFLSTSKTSDHSDFVQDKDWLDVKRAVRKVLLDWLREIEKDQMIKLARRDSRRLRKLLRDLDVILNELPEMKPATLRFDPEELRQKPKKKGTKKTGKKRHREYKIEQKKPTSKPVGRSRFGVGVTFDSVEDGPESWVSGETIVINKAHPAYKRARASRMLYYHELKCCANELIKLNPPKVTDDILEKAFEMQEHFFTKWAGIADQLES